MIDLEKANKVLDELKEQKREAENRVYLLMGAVQGAEAVIAEAEKETDSALTTVKQTAKTKKKNGIE